MAVYITGLSYLARAEHAGRQPRWPMPVLFAPVVVAIVAGDLSHATVWAAIGAFSLWTVWCLPGLNLRRPGFLPGGVSGLLAGIALVDWVAQSGTASGLEWTFPVLFLQRLVPAT